MTNTVTIHSEKKRIARTSNRSEVDLKQDVSTALALLPAAEKVLLERIYFKSGAYSLKEITPADSSKLLRSALRNLRAEPGCSQHSIAEECSHQEDSRTWELARDPDL